jgi:electron transfer flavoprotein alpha subunit
VELVLDEMTPLDVKAERTGRWRLPPAEIDLAEAQFIIGVGKGVHQESMAAVRALAERVGAAVGGSRMAVFQGLVPLDRQIGSTGRWISPEVYLTLGISGASYHVMGIRGAKHIIAVNTDRNAPILKLAELGIVGDLHQVVLAMLDTVSASDGSQGRPS